MNAQTAKFLTISILMNVVLLGALHAQTDELNRYKKHKIKMDTWAKMMTDMIKENIDLGGEMRSSTKGKVDLAAYLIMRENGLI